MWLKFHPTTIRHTLRAKTIPTMWIGTILWKIQGTLILIACGDSEGRNDRQASNPNRQQGKEELPKGGCELQDLHSSREDKWQVKWPAAVYRMYHETEQEAWMTLGMRPAWRYVMKWWKQGIYRTDGKTTRTIAKGELQHSPPNVTSADCKTRDREPTNRGGYFWIVQYDPNIDKEHRYKYNNKTGKWTEVPVNEIYDGNGRTKWLPHDSHEWRQDHGAALMEIFDQGLFKDEKLLQDINGGKGNKGYKPIRTNYGNKGRSTDAHYTRDEGHAPWQDEYHAGKSSIANRTPYGKQWIGKARDYHKDRGNDPWMKGYEEYERLYMKGFEAAANGKGKHKGYYPPAWRQTAWGHNNNRYAPWY